MIVILNNVNGDISNNNISSVTCTHVHVNIVAYIDVPYDIVSSGLINLILYH